jgi:hypothetical protein
MTTLAAQTSERTSEAAPAPRRPVRLAVAGLGRSGIVHAAVGATIPGVSVVGLADPSAAARRRARGIGFTAPAFEKLDRMLARAKPEALIVCANGDTRVDACRAALQAGVPVLADRPLASDAAGVEEIVRLARERRLALACSFGLFFHPVFARARVVLAPETLGALRHVRASVYVSRVFSAARQRRVAPPGAVGGVLAHQALDVLSLLVETLGVPAEVRATASRIYGEHEDEVHASLLLPGGLEVGLDASWSVPGYPVPATVLEVEAEHGKLLVSDDALEIDLTEPRPGHRAGHTRLGLADLPQTARFELEGGSPYLSVASFLDWATGGPAPPHADDAVLRTHRVLDAIYRSLRDGGARIPVSA